MLVAVAWGCRHGRQFDGNGTRSGLRAGRATAGRAPGAGILVPTTGGVALEATLPLPLILPPVLEGAQCHFGLVAHAQGSTVQLVDEVL